MPIETTEIETLLSKLVQKDAEIERLKEAAEDLRILHVVEAVGFGLGFEERLGVAD